MPDYKINGYEPSVAEVMQDMGVTEPEQIQTTVLNRLRHLYNDAILKGNLRRFPESPYDFIICDSDDFYRTLVNAGYGSVAMGFIDRWNAETFFLLFRDKVPEEFYPMPVIHESAEYDALKRGVEPDVAHQTASKKEIELSERLGKKQGYSDFIKERYPRKYNELCEMDLL